MDEVNQITEKIIGREMEVHRNLGPGLLAAVYEGAPRIEFPGPGISYKRQIPIPIRYKNRMLGGYQLEFVVEDSVAVEIKSVERFDPVFEAQSRASFRVAEKENGRSTHPLQFLRAARWLKEVRSLICISLCLRASVANS